MSPLKHAALWAYYAASLPTRRRAAARRQAAGREPVSVLFYHRVADEHPNDWTMPRRVFQRQVRWMAERMDIIPLSEAQRRIAAGENHRPAVALTFDDGYADNCDFALPLLLRLGLPVTYFVSTRHVVDDLPFPHDVEAGVRLRPNTIEQLRAMAEAGVEIGAHTRTHADLGAPANQPYLAEEIAGSKADLEEALGWPVRYFAFPYGLKANLSAEAFRVAYAAGLEGVCSAYGAYNLPGGDPFHLRRIHADPEMLRFKNWLTVDPRKLQADDFDAGDYRAPAPPSEPASPARAAGGDH